MALYDILKNKQQTPALAPAPQQAQIQQTLQTKATGKVAQTTGPKASTVGETVAADKFKLEQQQVAQEGQIQESALAQKSAQIQQDAEQQKADLQFQASLKQQGIQNREIQALTKIRSQEDLAKLQQTGNEGMKVAALSHSANQAFYKLAQETNINLNNLTFDLQQKKKELSSEEAMAEIDQRVFISALRSKEYVQKITQIGNLQKLSDDTVFKKEAMIVTMGHRASMLQEDLSARISSTMQEQAAAAKRAQAERQAVGTRNQAALTADKFRKDMSMADSIVARTESMTRTDRRSEIHRGGASTRAVEQRKANMAAAIEQANREVQIANELMQNTLKQEKFAAGTRAIQSTIMAGVYAGSQGVFDSAPEATEGVGPFRGGFRHDPGDVSATDYAAYQPPSLLRSLEYGK